MATQQATPTAEILKPQRTIFNLDTMEEVTLSKTIEFHPVSSAAEFTDRLKNDSAKILEVMNRGLRAVEQNSAVDDPNIPWMVTDEEGKESAFSGTPANMAGVNNLVLSLAKQIFGYTKDSSVEEKRAAKESAIGFIRANDQIREGLKKNASL